MGVFVDLSACCG